MRHLQWQTIPREQLNPAITRQMIHGDRMTIARLRLAKGALVPEHSHANEQISMIEEGTLRFVLDGTEVVARAGDLVVIPGGVTHSVEALEDSAATDIFVPVREDWVRGDDAYLRGR